jgi:putative N6-adenine-specific DNA methylase
MMRQEEKTYRIVATSTFGLEAVVARELKGLGYEDLTVENGRISFTGRGQDVARCNLWLRCADRVLIEMARFQALDFEELYQGTLAIPWEWTIPVDGRMDVTGRSARSRLFSVRDCQSVVKKAVVDAMRRRYTRERFDENGPVYGIEVALLNDVATLTIDTSGPGLNRRGYRRQAGLAPLKETLAAALVLLSRWSAGEPFADPLCGSGTIPIEAALIGRNIAPGLTRSFVSETWVQFPPALWKEVRREARAAARPAALTLLASDRDEGVLAMAKENANRAGVGDSILFRRADALGFTSGLEGGTLVTNPPYGERLGEGKDVEELYRILGSLFRALGTWHFLILSAHTGFERFFGRKADRNRKLYNGDIRCYLYEYGYHTRKKPGDSP